MPKATCPACQSDVKFSKDAEPGDTVTCPECDEVFTPPQLKKKAKKEKKYNPLDEETYEVGHATSNADEKEKTRKAGAVMRAAMAEQRRKKKAPPRPLFGGFEIVLLVFAVVVTAALGLGFVVAKRFPNTGEGALIVVAYVGAMLVFAARVARARNQLGG
jgi:uncharacterized Zn finger protein (UPF0148 family)